MKASRLLKRTLVQWSIPTAFFVGALVLPFVGRRQARLLAAGLIYKCVRFGAH